jgi:hypothetical protein
MTSQMRLEVLGVEVVNAVFMKFSFFRISSNFRLKNSNGLFARDACLVKCLLIFLVFKLSFARTSPHKIK